ncbi:MAG TPA: hypothetical protein PK096_00185 [Candidatus Saccharibacteria bacterium]|nr:hypothetical protein [Candidatus Saccharibacteria bacterium]HRK93773.1 hypothetical protein [Candidatus Saccharibacteria bacterium]
MTKTPQQSLFSVMAVVLLVLALVLQTFLAPTVSAAQITDRKLTLQAGASDGGSKPGGVVNHLFNFTVPTTGNVGSIKFEYCTLAAGTCTTPTGLSTTSATLGSESGATGFSIVNTTNGSPYLTRTAASITASTAVAYQLSTVTNPTTEGTFFVRISTYASTNTTGGTTDTGSVAASTAEQIILSGTMPESLVFCAGGTVSTTSSVPDCGTATSGAISFNQLFSPTDTAIASSQMAASTNAGFGYVISVNGPTLTSGANTVTGMNSATTSIKGVSQFGLNLKANTVSAAASFPGSSAEVAPAANGTNYKGQAITGYDTVDTFKFTSGDSVANSSNGGAGGTDAQIFTVSYIANVPGSQPAGTYTTTLTYICTPTY